MIRRIAAATIALLAAGPALADVAVTISNSSSVAVQWTWSGEPSPYKTLAAGGNVNVRVAGNPSVDVDIIADGKSCNVTMTPVVVDAATKALRCDPAPYASGSGVRCSAYASQNNVPTCVVTITFGLNITQ